MSSAEQNDSQSEEINVMNESQVENRSMSVQEAEEKKRFFFCSAILFVVFSSC